MRLIPNFPGYFATKDGRIYSAPRKGPGGHKGKYLKQFTNDRGYLEVGLWKARKKPTKRIHRLILETFVGPCPDGMEACHNNGIRIDNRLENLRWDTRSNNAFDAIVHRTFIGNTKLNLRQAHIINYLLKFPNEFIQREIGKLFGVSRSAINFIKTGRRWKEKLLNETNI